MPFFKQSNFIKNSLIPYWMVCCFSACSCSHKKRRRRARYNKAMNEAREKLEKEINIIEIIKQQRYFAKAINELIVPSKRFDLKEKSRYITINPDKTV